MTLQEIIAMTKRVNEKDPTLTLKDLAELSDALGFDIVTFPDFKYSQVNGLNETI
jgi:hypothetical protein